MGTIDPRLSTPAVMGSRRRSRFVVGRRPAAFTSAVDISAGTSSRAAGAGGRGDQVERTRRCCGR